MKNFRVARRYATALMNAADERHTLEKVAADLESIMKILDDSREFGLFVASPVISAAKKTAIFNELLGKQIGEDVLTFFMLLTQKGREELIPDIIGQFRALHDQKLGVVDAQVTAALELGKEQTAALQARLEKHTSRKVRLQVDVDERIKGGLVIQIDDTVFDASISHQLELLRSRLLAGGIQS